MVWTNANEIGLSLVSDYTDKRSNNVHVSKSMERTMAVLIADYSTVIEVVYLSGIISIPVFAIRIQEIITSSAVTGLDAHDRKGGTSLSISLQLLDL